MEDVGQWTAFVVFDAENDCIKSLATSFHAFLKDVLNGYKFASVHDELLDLPADTIEVGTCYAISLAIWPEGFTDVLTWLQVHRPPPLIALIVPLTSNGYQHSDILQRSLWLGHQPEVSNAATDTLSAVLRPADPPTGTQDTFNASKGWGRAIFGATDKMVELRDKAAALLVHFHAHVYVDPTDEAGSVPAWKAFYRHIAATFRDNKYVVESKLTEGPMGPHPASQFEIVFFRPAYQEFLHWLLVNRPTPLPILIHPMLYNTEADQLYGVYYDHSRRAIWFGKQVPNLDLDVLASADEKVHAGTERPYGNFDWQRPRGQEGSPAINISA